MVANLSEAQIGSSLNSNNPVHIFKEGQAARVNFHKNLKDRKKKKKIIFQNLFFLLSFSFIYFLLNFLFKTVIIVLVITVSGKRSLMVVLCLFF